jgi:hypothetical protein
VRPFLLVLLLSCLAACAPKAVGPAPRARATLPVNTWRCALRPSSRVTCLADLRPAFELALPFAALTVAARARGGAYALGEGGLLARISAAGVITGMIETPLRSLIVAHDFVCGLDDANFAWCARDAPSDRVCAQADMLPFVQASAEPVVALRDAREGDALCALDDHGVRHCVPARATCDRACLAFPVCDRPRCVDPCAAYALQRRSSPSGLFFLSSSTPALATSSR